MVEKKDDLIISIILVSILISILIFVGGICTGMLLKNDLLTHAHEIIEMDLKAQNKNIMEWLDMYFEDNQVLRIELKCRYSKEECHKQRFVRE